MLAADLQTVYEDFVLLISSRTSRRAEYPIHVISSPAGETSDRTQLNSVWKRIQEALRKIEAGHRGTRLFQDVGTALFDAIFGGAIGELYRTSEGYAQGRGYGLRLRFRVEPPELSFLPWELLFDSFHDRFVARWPNRPLSRHVATKGLQQPLETVRPLRLLVVISNPVNLEAYHLGELDADKERNHIEEAPREWRRAGVLKIEAMDHAIVSEIGDRLRDFRPHLLHFIGHGSFRKVRREDRGCIVLEDVKRRCKLIDEKVFAEMLDAEMTRLVVLNACETATSSSLRALSGMAARLVQVGMSAVVAMRTSLSWTHQRSSSPASSIERSPQAWQWMLPSPTLARGWFGTSGRITVAGSLRLFSCGPRTEDSSRSPIVRAPRSACPRTSVAGRT